VILLVEDDVDLADTCCMVLETCGYEVRVAHDVEDALAKIAERAPALLISDCIMPGRTGLALSLEVRTRFSRTDLPILLMSGSLRSEVAFGDSYDAFLSKPFPAESLLLQVEKLLHKDGAAPAAPGGSAR
jgi:DNA-binding response OmpR family regulator